MPKTKETSVVIKKESGRSLPVTNTSTPKPPTKPPAQPGSGSGTKPQK